MEATYPHPTSTRAFPFTPVGTDVRVQLERLLQRLGPDAVFGDPVRQGEVVVVPVAEVRVGAGFGSGFGPPEAGDTQHDSVGQATARDPEQGVGEEAPVSGGGGGGLGGRVVPRGFIKMTARNARFVPAVDATRIVLGGLAVAALTVLVVARTLVLLRPAVEDHEEPLRSRVRTLFR